MRPVRPVGDPGHEAYVPPLAVVVQQLDTAQPARLVLSFEGLPSEDPTASGHFGQHPQWELPHWQWELPHRREAPYLSRGASGAHALAQLVR